ncbi:MAG TPA: hypothetical protein VD731_05845 [Nitrosopumilaceae archaeon]|nr:hypothetical protein [Nitrosopumilaceae archaeon]
MLVNKKIFVSGVIMIIVGGVISFYLNSISPVGTPGMTEEEALEIIIAQRENQDYNTLAGLLMGIGFMLVLISFGVSRKRKGNLKRVEKKPEP